MHKYTIADLEKAITYLKTKCHAVYVVLDIDHMGRLELKGSDITGNRVSIIVYDESTSKMPDVTRTERL